MSADISLKSGVSRHQPASTPDPAGSETFCVLPWAHLNLRADGRVYPCCAAVDERPLGSMRDASLESIWNSENLRRMRLNMLAGRKSPECERCYTLERNNVESVRNQHNRALAPYVSAANATRPDGGLDDFSVVYLHLSLSNVCNFKCRYCDELTSTAWYPERVRFWGGRPGHPVVLTPTVDPKDLWNQLEAVLPRLKWIHFTGGEPLILEEHYRILEFLASRGLYDVRLSYTTNFSQTEYRDFDVLDIWSRFSDVDVAASLDGSGARGEYIRKNMKWDDIVRNRERMLKVCPNVRFQIAASLSVFNALHLPDFHRAWLEKGFVAPENFRMGIILDPEEYCVQALPSALKRKAADKFSEHVRYLSETYGAPAGASAANFRGAIEFMNEKDSSHLLELFRLRTAQLDETRNEHFTDIFPELAEMMAGA